LENVGFDWRRTLLEVQTGNDNVKTDGHNTHTHEFVKCTIVKYKVLNMRHVEKRSDKHQKPRLTIYLLVTNSVVW